MYRINALERHQSIVKLDAKDYKIIEHISRNSRMSFTQLGKIIGLKKETLLYRVNRLKKIGIVQKFFAQPNLNKFGIRKYHVFMLLDYSSKKRKAKLLNDLINHPNTISLFEYSDKWDFEWVLASRRLSDFDKVLSDFMAEYSDIIIERSKFVVLKTYYSSLFPSTENGKEPICCFDSSFDKKDYGVLSSLVDDARTSTYSMGDKVHLSADAVSLRIKKLRSKCAIREFTTLFNLSRLGYKWYTLVFQMKYFSPELEEKLRYIVQTHPNIVYSVKTIGHWDFLFNIVAKNSAEFHKTFKFLKKEFEDVIRNYSTFNAFREHVFKPLPDIVKNQFD